MAKKTTRFDWVRDAEEPVTPRKDRASRRDRREPAREADGLIDPMLALPVAALELVPLQPEALRALEVLRGISSHGARRRQRMHLCAILRGHDLEAIAEAIGQGSTKANARDEALEALVRWRTRMVRDGDEAISAFVEAYPTADRQRIRQLAAQLRSDPHSRAKKLLMGILKEAAGL